MKITHLEALDGNILLIRETETNDIEHGSCWIKMLDSEMCIGANEQTKDSTSKNAKTKFSILS